MPYIELQSQSRGYSVTTDSVTQTFVYRICDEDLDEVDSGTEFGSFFSPNDDAGLAQFVYATFPVYRTFPVSVSDNITLYLTQHSATEDDSGWIVTLTYSIPQGDQLDPSYIQFGIDLGGETEHISKSIGVLSSAVKTGSSLTPPNTYGMIGITKDNITGTDIVSKSMNFNITSYFDASIWTTSALNALYLQIATTNNALFYGFAAGEVLLVSISAQGDNSYKKVPVTFNFSAKPNAVALADYGFPALTAPGHAVIDYLYSNAVDQNFPLKLPNYRFVHQVYQTSDFSLLGIGT